MIGTLSGPDAQPYGYELTIFRTGLTPPDEAPDSPPAGWRTNQLYLAHFAVTDGAHGAVEPGGGPTGGLKTNGAPHRFCPPPVL